MVSLKKLFLISSALIAVGCAAKFDPVEHARIIDIRHTVSEATAHGHCGDPNTARVTAQRISSDVNWFVLYSQHIPKNESAQKMGAELKRITDEFAQRYQQSQPPSKIYCELKLKNIAATVDVIQQTNARRAR